jgi:ADP-ribose pyrophosphatase
MNERIEKQKTAPIEILAEGRFMRLCNKGGYEFVERTNSTGIVIIVPVTDNGELVLVEQYRPPVGAMCIELPAGLAGDIPGQEDEDLEIAARRELLEETGYEAEVMSKQAIAPPTAGMCSEIYTIYFAGGLKKTGPGGGDENEDIIVHEVNLNRMDEWLAEQRAAGKHVALTVYAGLHFADRWLQTPG